MNAPLPIPDRADLAHRVNMLEREMYEVVLQLKESRQPYIAPTSRLVLPCCNVILKSPMSEGVASPYSFWRCHKCGLGWARLPHGWESCEESTRAEKATP